MTPHISARKGEIAKKVIMTGDPLRARRIAESYLPQRRIVSEVRGNYIFTGKTTEGWTLSVMASGMGMGSMGIYCEELYRFYGVEQIIRIGTMGSYQKKVRVGESVVAISSCTDSSRNRELFHNYDYAATAGTEMLYRAMQGFYHDPQVHFGVINSSEFFYREDAVSYVKNWAQGGVLGVEMETACLYTTAKRYRKEALTILLTTDSLVNPKERILSPEERETQVEKNISIAFSAFGK